MTFYLTLALICITALPFSLYIFYLTRRLDNTNQQCSSLQTELNNSLIKIETINARYTEQLLNHQKEIHDLKQTHEKNITKSIAASKKIIESYVWENFAPSLQNKFSLKDFRHFGDPIDYVIFDGAAAVRDGLSEEINQIIFLDIKTGESSLSKVQRKIRDALLQNRISFLTYNPETNTYKDWKKQ